MDLKPPGGEIAVPAAPPDIERSKTYDFGRPAVHRSVRQRGFEWFRVVQGGSGWFRLVQAGSGWFRLVQAGSSVRSNLHPTPHDSVYSILLTRGDMRRSLLLLPSSSRRSKEIVVSLVGGLVGVLVRDRLDRAK